jgi:proteic killer suppression protein
MIRSFRSRETERLFRLERVARWISIERPALRKLKQFDLAETLGDMRAPPGNRLEALSGNRAGQWSVRINDQYRLCFRWGDDGPHDVEIVDYH